jgi:hemerythrin
MAVFVWNEKFSVGMKSMDDQHKHFLDLLNNLDDEIQRKSSNEIVKTAIDALVNYGMTHFRAEEKILFACGYPEIKQQLQEHSYFVSQVKEIETSHQGGSLVHMGSLVSLLRDWFINHIMIEDKKYAAFV